MTWAPNQGSFDPDKHARRKEERARLREQQAEEQRQEEARLASEEAERAARVQASLSRNVPPQTVEPTHRQDVRGTSLPQTRADSYRITRTGVGCWGFAGLYIIFFMLFSIGAGALLGIDETVGAIAGFAVPVVAYYVWRNYYRQYRSVFGFFLVAGGLLGLGLILAMISIPISS